MVLCLNLDMVLNENADKKVLYDNAAFMIINDKYFLFDLHFMTCTTIIMKKKHNIHSN